MPRKRPGLPLHADVLAEDDNTPAQPSGAGNLSERKRHCQRGPAQVVPAGAAVSDYAAEAVMPAAAAAAAAAAPTATAAAAIQPPAEACAASKQGSCMMQAAEQQADCPDVKVTITAPAQPSVHIGYALWKQGHDTLTLLASQAAAAANQRAQQQARQAAGIPRITAPRNTCSTAQQHAAAPSAPAQKARWQPAFIRCADAQYQPASAQLLTGPALVRSFSVPKPKSAHWQGMVCLAEPLQLMGLHIPAGTALGKVLACIKCGTLDLNNSPACQQAAAEALAKLRADLRAADLPWVEDLWRARAVYAPSRGSWMITYESFLLGATGVLSRARAVKLTAQDKHQLQQEAGGREDPARRSCSKGSHGGVDSAATGEAHDPADGGGVDSEDPHAAHAVTRSPSEPHQQHGSQQAQQHDMAAAASQECVGDVAAQGCQEQQQQGQQTMLPAAEQQAVGQVMAAPGWPVHSREALQAIASGLPRLEYAPAPEEHAATLRSWYAATNALPDALDALGLQHAVKQVVQLCCRFKPRKFTRRYERLVTALQSGRMRKVQCVLRRAFKLEV